MSEEKEYRVGIIRVTNRLMKEAGITIEQTDKGFVPIKDTHIFDQVKRVFLLPENYTIREIFSYPMLSVGDANVWGILVESPDLPVLTGNTWPPELRPIYTRSDSGQAQLVKIEM